MLREKLVGELTSDEKLQFLHGLLAASKLFLRLNAMNVCPLKLTPNADVYVNCQKKEGKDVDGDDDRDCFDREEENRRTPSVGRRMSSSML